MSGHRLLDVSRLVSRAGLTPTGVDRVEYAYLRAFCEIDRPACGLARTALGYVLLDQTGLAALEVAIRTNAWGRFDLLSRWNRRLSDSAKRGQSFVRSHAVARSTRNALEKTLTKAFSGSFAYYNTGHSNLNAFLLRAIRAAGGRSSVLIHDTIPLDWPKMQRDGTVAQFAAKLDATVRIADRVICTTHAVADDLARHHPKHPDTVIAPLGVDRPMLQQAAPQDLPARPYFLVLGTIEPRKNHAMLLDIWESWPDAPPLVIAGRRGWKNAKVFAKLDAGVRHVIERNDISDGDLAHWIASATALLMPSFAEGYGLPPAEALALGTPVIVADLPACHEVLGEHAVYADPSDRYQWEKAIKAMADGRPAGHDKAYVPPDWTSHFNHVLTADW